MVDWISTSGMVEKRNSNKSVTKGAKKNTRNKSEDELTIKLEEQKRATNSFKRIANDAKNKIRETYVTQMGNEGAVHKF